MAAKKPSGLGRGLGALLGDEALKNDSGGVLTVPISQVENCSSQPRKAFDPEALEELAESIRQHGILQPLTVRRLQSGYYQIIAGERRWRASRRSRCWSSRLTTARRRSSRWWRTSSGRT